MSKKPIVNLSEDPALKNLTINQVKNTAPLAAPTKITGHTGRATVDQRMPLTAPEKITGYTGVPHGDQRVPLTAPEKITGYTGVTMSATPVDQQTITGNNTTVNVTATNGDIQRIIETPGGTVVVVTTDKEVIVNSFEEVAEQKFISYGRSGVLQVGIVAGSTYSNVVNNASKLGFDASSFFVTQIGDGVAKVSTFSGYSGLSGLGISGYSGLPGAFSASGYSGLPGESGISGFSGYTGASGVSGDTGSSGISGYSGLSGTNGDSGQSGVSGFSGEAFVGSSGYSGLSGDAGASGFSGEAFVGSSGFSGLSGDAGASGYSGLSGDAGASGYSGEAFVGSSGFSGLSGEAGTSGFSGLSGDAGASGFSGINGSTSESGVSGYSGTNGSAGESGVSGYSGTNGSAGESGYSGSAGSSGFSGQGLGSISSAAVGTNALYYNSSTQVTTYGPLVSPIGGFLTHNVLSSTDYQFVQASPTPGWISQATTGRHLYLHSGSMKSLTFASSGSPASLAAYSSATNGQYACKTWFFMPAMFRKTMTFSYVGMDCVKVGAGSTTSTIQILVYSDNSGVPGTLLYDWGTATNRLPNGSGIGYPVWLTGSYQFEGYKQYWIAVLVDGTNGNVNVSRINGVSDDVGFAEQGRGSATSDTLYKSGNTQAIIGTWLGGTPGAHTAGVTPGDNPSFGGLYASAFSIPLLAFAT